MIAKIKKWLKQQGYDGLILTRRDNFSWLTRGCENHVLSSTETGVASLLITQQNIQMFVDCSDAQRMNLEQNPLDAEVIEVEWYHSVENVMKEAIGDQKVVSDTGILGTKNVQSQLLKMRLLLDEQEISRYREIGRECAGVVEQVCFEAKPGDTEQQIATRVKAGCLEKGISPDCVLVGSDERIIQYRHPMPTDKKIEKSLMVVLGGEKYGLNISMTRMIYFDQIPAEISWKYTKVQEIFASMQLMMKDGMNGDQYFSKVIELYHESGYPQEWKKHHQGGSTGYACREEVFRPDSQSKINAGQAYAWNPTITGVKCEETTFLTKTGVEVFTRSHRWPVRSVETPYGTMVVAEILSQTK